MTHSSKEISKRDADSSDAQPDLDDRPLGVVRLSHGTAPFRLLVESVTDYAIFMLDPGGHVATWNIGAERIKGYSADEVIGRHFSLFYTEEDITRDWPGYELKVAAAEGRFEAEGWRLRKDGSLFWASVIITALYEHGRLLGFAKVTRDLTERRRAEEELRQSHALLEKRVQDRTAEIEQLVQQLERADRRKNDFLATLAHELRNPLAPIRHALHILHQAADDPGLEQQARGVIERQVGQMVRLVDDLLDASRIANDKLPLRKERIKISDAVESALETIRPFIEKAGHELTVTLSEVAVYVNGDLTRLAQVFTNLLTNAVKYTESGGSIWLAVEKQGGEAVVTLRDTGIGISAEHLPHIFEMFSQVAPALERSEGGLGVGLALARGMVELHGGRIEAHSQGPGEGSELIVRLPISEVREAAEVPRETPPDLSQAETESRPRLKGRVLIADDNRDSADSLSLLLELMGCTTWTAHDGLEAVQAAAAHRPDVVLLDIGMPRINGYEAASRIREEPWGKSMLLVAITGWGQDDDKQLSREAGFDHHLTKPVSFSELTSLLESVEAQRS